MATRLGRRFPILYAGANGRVAHECILDTRVLKASSITAEDICRRLIDYGFHAPHTARGLVAEWTHSCGRATTAYPMGATADKYWPPVGRIDGAHSDKNLVCSCPDIDDYR